MSRGRGGPSAGEMTSDRGNQFISLLSALSSPSRYWCCYRISKTTITDRRLEPSAVPLATPVSRVRTCCNLSSILDKRVDLFGSTIDLFSRVGRSGRQVEALSRPTDGADGPAGGQVGGRVLALGPWTNTGTPAGNEWLTSRWKIISRLTLTRTFGIQQLNGWISSTPSKRADLCRQDHHHGSTAMNGVWKIY